MGNVYTFWEWKHFSKAKPSINNQHQHTHTHAHSHTHIVSSHFCEIDEKWLSNFFCLNHAFTSFSPFSRSLARLLYVCVMRLVWRFWCFSLLMLCHFCSKHDLCHWSVCLLRRNKLWFGVVYGTLLWLCVVDILHQFFLSLSRTLSLSLTSLFAIYLYHDIFLSVCFFIHLYLLCVLLRNNCYASFRFIAVFSIEN